VIEDAEIVDTGAEAQLRAAAEAFVLPGGQYGKAGAKAKELGHPDGMTLKQVHDLGDEGRTWLRWALRNVNATSVGGEQYMAAIWTFAHFNDPELYQQVKAEKEAS
jgi:hypothetical protein